MSIECEGRVGYGWEIESSDDIPEYGTHADYDWYNAFETKDGNVVIDGTVTKWEPYELVVDESAYHDDPPIFVGIPLPYKAEAKEFRDAIDSAAMMAPHVWHAVMGDLDMPTPRVICYERWY